MFTPLGRVTTQSTASATASGASIAERGGYPGRPAARTSSQAAVSTGPGDTSDARTPVPASSARTTSCSARAPCLAAAYAAFSG